MMRLPTSRDVAVASKGAGDGQGQGQGVSGGGCLQADLADARSIPPKQVGRLQQTNVGSLIAIGQPKDGGPLDVT